MGKYDHLVHFFDRNKNNWGEFMPAYQAYFRGEDCMEGADFYSPYRCYMKEAFIDRVSNFHSEEEYLSFVGYDMSIPGAPSMRRFISASAGIWITWRNMSSPSPPSSAFPPSGGTAPWSSAG